MRNCSKKWVVALGMTALLTAGQASMDGLTSWANQAPDTSDGEVNLDFARQPGQDGSSSGHGSSGGQTEGIRQGADPNDFSVSSPRKPHVPTVAAPAQRDPMASLRNWLNSLLTRFAGLVRRS